MVPFLSRDREEAVLWLFTTEVRSHGEEQESKSKPEVTEVAENAELAACGRPFAIDCHETRENPSGAKTRFRDEDAHSHYRPPYFFEYLLRWL